MSERVNECSAACDCSTDLLQVNLHYRDGVVSKRTVSLGDRVTISAGQGFYIERVEIFPAVKPIKGVECSRETVSP